MLGFFPSLAEVAITHRWGGPSAYHGTGTPRWASTPPPGRRWAGPYVGDGVATSNLAARILRNLILRRDEPINDLPIVNHRSPRWEPEPLRWIGVNAGLSPRVSATPRSGSRGAPPTSPTPSNASPAPTATTRRTVMPSLTLTHSTDVAGALTPAGVRAGADSGDPRIGVHVVAPDAPATSASGNARPAAGP